MDSYVLFLCFFCQSCFLFHYVYVFYASAFLWLYVEVEEFLKNPNSVSPKATRLKKINCQIAYFNLLLNLFKCLDIPQSHSTVNQILLNTQSFLVSHLNYSSFIRNIQLLPFSFIHTSFLTKNYVKKATLYFIFRNYFLLYLCKK